MTLCLLSSLAEKVARDGHKLDGHRRRHSAVSVCIRLTPSQPAESDTSFCDARGGSERLILQESKEALCAGDQRYCPLILINGLYVANTSTSQVETNLLTMDISPVLKAFAACAVNRTVTATWICRKERLAMNSCMVAHATPEEEDRAREEWFAGREERRLAREKEDREREERRKIVIDMMRDDEAKRKEQASRGSWWKKS